MLTRDGGKPGYAKRRHHHRDHGLHRWLGPCARAWGLDRLGLVQAVDGLGRRIARSSGSPAARPRSILGRVNVAVPTCVLLTRALPSRLSRMA